MEQCDKGFITTYSASLKLHILNNLKANLNIYGYLQFQYIF